jgi:hypothetical protein
MPMLAHRALANLSSPKLDCSSQRSLGIKRNKRRRHALRGGFVTIGSS